MTKRNKWCYVNTAIPEWWFDCPVTAAQAANMRRAALLAVETRQIQEAKKHQRRMERGVLYWDLVPHAARGGRSALRTASNVGGPRCTAVARTTFGSVVKDGQIQVQLRQCRRRLLEMATGECKTLCPGHARNERLIGTVTWPEALEMLQRHFNPTVDQDPELPVVLFDDVPGTMRGISQSVRWQRTRCPVAVYNTVPRGITRLKQCHDRRETGHPFCMRHVRVAYVKGVADWGIFARALRDRQEIIDATT